MTLPQLEFDAALFLYGQAAVQRPDDLAAILVRARSALRHGSPLAIEVREPTAVERSSGTSWWVGADNLWGRGRHLVLEEREWDDATRATGERFVVIDERFGGVVVFGVTERMLEPRDLEALSAQAGFATSRVHHGWGGLPIEGMALVMSMGVDPSVTSIRSGAVRRRLPWSPSRPLVPSPADPVIAVLNIPSSPPQQARHPVRLAGLATPQRPRSPRLAWRARDWCPGFRRAADHASDLTVDHLVPLAANVLARRAGLGPSAPGEPAIARAASIEASASGPVIGLRGALPCSSL